MKAWDRFGLAEFKRTAREGKLYLDTEPSFNVSYDGKSEITKVKETLNNIILWLTELEEYIENEQNNK
ncbi:MAG: hypothetical protein U9N61_00160 [Euryarchaeota archaeon]|nr:hypothetical protein [Euryarchaeota archaeon]